MISGRSTAASVSPLSTDSPGCRQGHPSGLLAAKPETNPGGLQQTGVCGGYFRLGRACGIDGKLTDKGRNQGSPGEIGPEQRQPGQIRCCHILASSSGPPHVYHHP